MPKKYQRNRYKKQMTRISKSAPIQATTSTIIKSSTGQKSPAPGSVIFSPYANELERHHQVTKELKTIGILTAILLPLLVILAVVLSKIG
jgi:hypothetical protein